MQEEFFIKVFTSHFICKGSKRVTQGLHVRGSGRPNINCNILTPLLWPSTLCLSRSPGLLNPGPTLLGDGFLYCISTSSHQGPKPLRPGVAFPTTSRLQLAATQLSWLSYTIVQRSLDRPRDLWNRMFNRHQAEITVMQFRGHYLPVRQSMRVSWDIFLPRPISSANFRPRNFLL